MKPILFNTEMVQAILEGRKTVTRRVIKPQPVGCPVQMVEDSCWPGCFASAEDERVYRPPYQPGDILWVRETWAHPSKEEIARGTDKNIFLYGNNVEVQRLTFGRDHTYEDLASYLTKEPREWGHPQTGERTWTPSLGLARPEPETESVPDYVTLTAPPEALILQCEGPIRNGYGEYAWLKYLLPKNQRRKRNRSRRRRRKKE